MIWILFFISIIILGTFIFFRFRNNHSQTLLRESTIQIARQKLSELNNHGKQIRKLQQSRLIPKQPPISTPINPKQQLPLEVINLRETALNILVAKYHLDSEIQSYISHELDEMFEKIINSLGKSLQDKIHSIQIQYDPEYSNELLLRCSRILMNHENLSPHTRLLVAQFIINTTSNGDELERIYDWIIEMGFDDTQSQQVRQEAVDMLILSNSSRYKTVATQILESLRQIDDADIPPAIVVPEPENNFPFNVQLPTHPRNTNKPRTIRIGGVDYDIALQRDLLTQFQRVKPKIERTVYQDGQSVHNGEINKSVIEAAKSLQSTYPAKSHLNFDTSLLKDLSPHQRQKIESALHRINTDDSTFGSGITLSGLFQSLQTFILSSPEKDELNKRLTQELEDMSGTCASGHLSRLVNVVQGFNTVPQQAIRIKLGDEIYATVNHSLTQALSKAENQEVSDAIIMGENQKLINNFVVKKLNALFPEMRKEYQGTAKDSEILQELLSAAKKYTKDEHFTIQQNEIIAR